MTRLRALLRGVTSLTALGAVILGLPWALLRWGQLPGAPGGGWWQRLPDSAVSDTTVFVVLTLAAWAVWALFTASAVVEAVAAARGVHAQQLRFVGPLQRPAQGLVAGVLLVGSLTRHDLPAFAGPRSPTAMPLPAGADAATSMVTLPANTPGTRADPTGETTGAAPSGDAPMGAAADIGPVTTAQVVVVERGDNPWTLAETHLGDGMRWRELWDLNRGVPQPDGRAWTDPEIIMPGWHLRLTPDSPSTPGTKTSSVAASTVHVEPGDTVSELAERYLGDPARYPELVDANRDTVQPDGRRLTDPDLIVVGWHLAIPAGPTQVAADGPAGPPPATAPPPTGESPARTNADASDQPTSTAPATTVTTVPTVTTEPPTNTSPTATPSAPATSAPATDGPSPASGKGPLVPVVAGISGAGALASGLALRFRWLRHRRATRGARTRPVATSPIEHAALTAADVPLVRWAGQHLALLVQRLDRRRLTAAPVAAELSDQTGLEILWDAPQHAPAPAGWTTADGGWAWRLPYDPDAPVPPDELTAAIPALVTIGRRDDRQLLVDLEAFGLLTVGGAREHADAFIRSLAVELACGNDLSDAYVTTVDLDVSPAIAPRHRLTTSDAATALAHIEHASRSVTEALQHDGAPDTFKGRTGARAPIEVTVVVARDPDPADLARLTDAAGPRHGVAVVATSPKGGTRGAHIEIDPSGTTARLDPLGITFQPVGVPTSTADAIHAAMADLADLPDETEKPLVSANGPHGDDHRDSIPSPEHPTDQPTPNCSNGDSPSPVRSSVENTSQPMLPDDAAGGHATDEQAIDVEHPALGRMFDPGLPPSEHGPRMVVRVLGVPTIPERPGIGRRELILAVLLACRGGTLAASAAQDSLWGGKPVETKTVWNFVANVRRALGEFDDGSPVMPAADRTRGTLRLDPRVTTDLALLREVVAQTHEVSSTEAVAALRDGLSLVEGSPFDAPGYDWAHRDQDVAEAAAVIEQAVDRLVELAVDAGRIDVAREAVTRGLRGLPGNEHCYRTRMRVEAAAGNHAGIVAAYDELTVYLAEFDTEPSPATTALYHELIRQPRGAPSSIK